MQPLSLASAVDPSALHHYHHTENPTLLGGGMIGGGGGFQPPPPFSGLKIANLLGVFDFELENFCRVPTLWGLVRQCGG